MLTDRASIILAMKYELAYEHYISIFKFNFGPF